MIMQKMRRAGHAPPKSKAGFYPVAPPRPPTGLKEGCRLCAASTRNDGFPSLRITPAIRLFRAKHATHCFIVIFLIRAAAFQSGTGVASIQATTLTKERIMKLQFGQNQLVLELSNAPFAWFHGQTERMSLTSLSLLFVQFSLFARQPAI
jgi:hypothetical protein